ncbi:unnamed protein product [Linum tenue]|uniref:LIM zinc-binding domain-containing protein n=1 Tax=Linum tenue TaxID=586396 RepID=A0AAV0LLE2_9ROSI|nr:unnamed protein product [Linum tenue]
MGWLSKIFKGSDHNISEGHYHENYEEKPNVYAPSASGDVWPEQEDEEMDRAIALSLLEESQPGKHVIDESQLQEDEQLARALQESLNIESPPAPPPPPQYRNPNAYHPGNIYQPAPVHFPMGFRICAGCNNEIGAGRFLHCLNAYWHPECFRCHACNLPIADYEEIIPITKLATRTGTIPNVMSASTLFQPTWPDLLNIGLILFGTRNIAPLMNMTILQDAAAVREWSLKIQDMYLLMMVGSSVWSVWILQSWIPVYASPFTWTYSNFMKA